MRPNTESDEGKHSKKGVLKAQLGRPAIAACMATVLVLLCVVAGPAFADENQLSNGLELASGAEEVADAGGLVNSDAAEELPHLNLDREGASKLDEGVFGPVLESAAGPFGDLQVDHFLANNVAVVDPAPPVAAGEALSEEELENTGPRLLDSTLPLRTENNEGQVREVDLDLEHREGEIQPTNPLVDVGIPDELGEGIKLPEMGITIGVGGAREQVSPSIVGKSVALYPNISQDSDFAVTPTPTGIETLTTIRSSQSPTQQRYTFDLPEGAELHLLKGDGGAEITQGGESLVQIPPASALDANGEPVETTLGESSGALTVSVEPGNDAAYPILVDPLFQTYEWKAKNSTTGINYNLEEEEWRQAEGLKIPMNSPGYTEWYLHKQVPTANYPIQAGWRGLYVHGFGELQAGDHFGYMYSVPRYYSDQKTYGTKPESYITRMELSNVVWIANSPGMSPYLTMGLYDPSSGYVSFYKHEGLTGHSITEMAYTYPFENTGDTSVKTAFVGFDSYENLKAINALYVGSASLQLAEPAGNIPGLTVKGVVPWSNGKTFTPVEFTATDSGLGVYSVTATDEKNSAHTWKATYGCTGIPGNPCPHTWKYTDVGHAGPLYDPSVLPDGEDYLKVTAQDPLGNVSATAYALVKLDRVSPSLALTGAITEQASLGTSRPSYELEINSGDGTSEMPQSGVAKTVIEIDGKVVNESSPGCTTQNCSGSRKWTLESGQYSSGAHVLKVVSTDAVGNATTKTQAFNLQPASPPSVALSGTATQQATLGASRPRYGLNVTASTSAGFNGMPMAAPTYAQSFGSTGTGNGQFQGARGAVIDSKGNFWVVDRGDGRVEQFNPKGEYLGQFGVKGENPGQLMSPAGLAIDAAGNFWVTGADGRVEQFSAKGEFIKQFSLQSSGDGQSSSPEDIAIDSKGNLWIVETGLNRVQEFTPEGKFLKRFGSTGSGGGQFNFPRGIAIDPNGNIWVTDASNNRLEKFDAEGKYLGQFLEAGTGNGNASEPLGIRVDQAGDLYVSEAGGRVQVFNAAGEYLTQFGSAGSGAGQLNIPLHLALDPAGSIWVVDNDNQVERWRAQSPSPAFSLSFGSKGTGAGQFTTPSSVATDSAGNLWVVDRANARIEKFNAKGEFLSQFGTKGSGAGQLSSPWGIALDPSGNVWVTDTTNARVVEFNGKGEFVATFGTNVNKTKVEADGSVAEKNLCTAASKNVCQAGVAGSLEGQMKQPMGITASPGGNLFVVEKGNGRVEKFSPTGELLANFGKPGTAQGQLTEPTAVAMSPDGNYLWVADSGNSRIQEWTSAYSFVQAVGKEGTGNGQFVEPYGLSIDSKDNVWVADTNANRVQEFSANGDFLSKFGKSGAGEGQLSIPYSLAADASGNIWIADTGHNQIQKWVPPTSRASTITSEITVDGVPVNTKVGRCGTEACSVTPEWMLEASAYAAGKHTIQVKATDGIGRSTTKSLTVELQKDTTKPALEASGSLVNAPEGWVEQQSYMLNATATDAGYGLNSLIAKIDGKQVSSWTNSCPDGGCKATLAKTIDLSSYAGGAHPAEIIATDGAGNVTKKMWTIKVDPEGIVSTEEVEATLEAVETTSPVNPIGLSEEEAEYPGTAPGLSMKSGGGGTIVPVGTRVPTIVPGEVTEPMTMEIPRAEAMSEPCQVEYLDPDEEAKAYGEKKDAGEITEEGKNFSEVPAVKTPTCKSSEEAEKKEEASEKVGNPAAKGMATISLEPTSTAAQASDTMLVSSIAAATADTASDVDTITRPLYDGVLTFQDIRNEAASQQFQWEVDLEGGLVLKLIDSQHAQVYYPGGHPAFTITAEAAHDAVGKAVPTSLSVGSGNVVTLTVSHRGKGYVYPVLSGTGWEGGFTSIEVQGPKDETELREEEELIERELLERREEEEDREPGEIFDGAVSSLGLHTIAMISTTGPPTPVAEASGPDTGWRQFTFAHKFKFNLCDYGVGGTAVPEVPRREALFAWLNSRPTKCREWVGEVKLDAGMAVRGWYRSNQKINLIWIKAGNLHCDKWGRAQPAMVNCVKRPEVPVATPGEIHLLGDYRFPPGNNYSATLGPYGTPPACVTVKGSIEMLQVHREEPIISSAHVGEKCDWP